MQPLSKTRRSFRLIPPVVMAALCVMLPALLTAQESVSEDDVVRFRRRVALGDGVEVVLHRGPDATGWTLRLLERDSGETLTKTELPDWAGADYYGYDLLTAKQGRAEIVLFEAAPAPGLEAPPAAESWQVAWAYGETSGEKEKRWRMIAETKSTPLDGGVRLIFRKVEGEERLVRIETSDRTTFCGSDLGSFEVFDDRQLVFRTRLELDQLVAGVEEIKAKPPEEPFEPSPFRNFYGWLSASSDRRNRDDARTAPRPIELGDRDLGSAWMEGAPGGGRGEFVTARISPALKMRGFRIFPGVGTSEEEYEKWSRPKSVLVSLSDGKRFVVEIPDPNYRTLASRNGLVVNFPEPVESDCLSVVILEEREGRTKKLGQEAWKREFTAISEITPFSELHGLPPDVAALVTVEMLLKERDPRRAQRLSRLVSPLGAELVKELRRVLGTGQEEDRVRVVPLLRGLPSEEAVDILVSLFERIDHADRSYPLIKRSLIPHGERGAEGLMELYRSSRIEEPRKRIDLVRLVGRLGTTAHRRELVESLGDGPARLRSERARAIARGGDALLPVLFEMIAAEPDSPRGWDALRVTTAIGRQKFYRSQGEAEGSEALLLALEKSEDRRSRILILRSLGVFRTDGAVDRLTTVLREDPNPIVRKEAVDAVGRYPGREARRAVEVGLADRSPDVRIAAITSIARRDDRQQSIPEVRLYTERERWDQGLAEAYTFLAEAGDEQTLDFIERSLARDPTTERAVLILESLERAERPLSDGVLFQVLDDPKATFLPVKHAIDLLGLSSSVESLDRLESVIERGGFPDRFDERKNESLRTRAILATGRRRTDPAARVLLELLRTTKDASVKRTALRGISFMANRSLIPELGLMMRNAPSSLRGDFEDAMESIDRRASVNEVSEGIEDLGEEPESGDEKRPPEGSTVE